MKHVANDGLENSGREQWENLRDKNKTMYQLSTKSLGKIYNSDTASRTKVGLILGACYCLYLLLTTVGNLFSMANPETLSSSNWLIFTKPKVVEFFNKLVVPLPINYHFLVAVAILVMTIVHVFLLTHAQSELSNARGKICKTKIFFSKKTHFFCNFALLSVAVLPLYLFIATNNKTYLNDSYYFLIVVFLLFAGLILQRTTIGDKTSLNVSTSLKFFAVELLIAVIVVSLSYLIFLYSWIIILLILVIVVATDVGAWFFGSLFGKTKITKLSPKKSYQGLVFGALFACLLATCYCYFLFVYGFHQSFCENWKFFATIGCVSFLLALVCQGSDIFFSVIKREAGVKDYSHIFQSHGGVLDRFDGFIGGYFVGAMLYWVIFYYFPG